MKFASFRTTSGDSWGGIDTDRILDLGPTGGDLAPSLRAAIAARILDREIPWDSAPVRRLNEVDLLPVIPDPGKIICVGVNYHDHAQEAGRVPAAAPTLFTRFADSQMGHGAAAVRPSSGEMFDYEGEVAVIISREAFRVDRRDASSYIAGYAPYNDFSVRDWQRHSSQWIAGKNFPRTGGFGPAMTRAEDVADVTSLVIETRVNGEVRQKATVADLIFTIPEIIEYVTAFTRLSPGDVIVTGTPAGVGLFFGEDGLLTHGDVVEVEVSELGTLRNDVVQETIEV